MTIQIHGREYKTVAERVNEIHEASKDKPLSIETELVSWSDSVVVFKAIVTTDQGVFTGHAYEDETRGQINKTSALENCETSAIGRALASAGYAGSEFASANEVENAIHQQKTAKKWTPAELEKRLAGIKKKFEDAGAVNLFNENLEANYSSSIVKMVANQHADKGETIINGLAKVYKQEIG